MPRDSMRGRRIDDEVLAHLSPPDSENINFSVRRGGHRGRAGATWPDRVSAAAGAQHPVLMVTRPTSAA